MARRWDTGSVYLDNNSTTAVRPEVWKAMEIFYRERWGNASSFHGMGRQAREGLEAARATLAQGLGVEAEDLLFTSGGTESDNIAIKAVGGRDRTRKNHIVTSAVEHLAVLESARAMEAGGFEVTVVGVDAFGRVRPEAVRKALRPTTALVSIMHANNEVGTIQPIEAIAKICKAQGVTFHTDAVQSFGKIPLRPYDWGVDLTSLSAHKIHGPKGVGCLVTRKGLAIERFLHGGHHERSLRAGTENVAGVVGFARAFQILHSELPRASARVLQLRDGFHQGLTERIEGVHLNGHPTERLWNTVNLRFDGVDNEAFLLRMDAHGIMASMASACTTGHVEPSHVLIAMGLSEEEAFSSVRFSLSVLTTQAQIERCLDVIPRIVRSIRRAPKRRTLRKLVR